MSITEKDNPFAHVVLGDRFMLLKPCGELNKLGESYEIARIIVDSGYVLRETATKMAVGLVKFEELERCFSPMDRNYWTKWQNFEYYDTMLWYKTNGKEVRVKDGAGNKGRSTCHKDDEFDIRVGLDIATMRYSMKKATKDSVRFIKEFIKSKEEARIIEKKLQSFVTKVNNREV